MYNNNNSNGNTPRRNTQLPPIDDSKIQIIEDRLRRQEETTNALLDRAVKIKEDILSSQEFIKGSVSEERRNRQLLDDHIRVITAVCKKLNTDIEALENQLSEKTYQITNIDRRFKETENVNSSANKDLQYKIGRTEGTISKLESDNSNLNGTLKDLKQEIKELGRTMSSRMNEIDQRMSDLNSKFESLHNDQKMLIRNVESDIAKQFQQNDERTGAMLENLRGQIISYKSSFDSEISKIEARMSQKIEETVRNSTNNAANERFDRKLGEVSLAQAKSQQHFEEEFKKQLARLTSSVEKLDGKMNRDVEDKQSKLAQECAKLKQDLKEGFADASSMIAALDDIIDQKILFSEEKLLKKIMRVKELAELVQ